MLTRRICARRPAARLVHQQQPGGVAAVERDRERGAGLDLAEAERFARERGLGHRQQQTGGGEGREQQDERRAVAQGVQRLQYPAERGKRRRGRGESGSAGAG